MRRLTRRQLSLVRHQRGFAMITCYMVLVLLMAMESTFLMRSLLGKHVAVMRQDSLGALYMAEGAVEQALQYLTTQTASPPASTVEIMEGASPLYAVPAAYANLGTVTATIDPDATVGVPNAYKITATATVGYSSRTVTVGAAIQSFATYAYFTNNPADSDTNTARPWFRSGQTITGPVHSNGYLRVMGTPTFTDVVTTSMDSILYAGGTEADGVTPVDASRSNPAFQSGAPQLNVPAKLFPQSATAALRAIAEPEGYVFKDAQYTLNQSGQVEVTGDQLTGYTINGSGELVPQYTTLTKQGLPLPPSGVIVDEGTAILKGTLVGQLTLGAQNISIKDNVLYNSGNPIVQPQGTDILGLVADNNVYINVNAPRDVEIDANIMALGSFRTEVDDAALNNLAARGSVTLYGSLAVNESRPLGATDANGNIVHGYVGQYNSDPRLKTVLQPPAFPKEQSLRILYWSSDQQQL
ncbi:MAG: DUF4900 domain-containing protein [Candidatus Omnitrophica bacterium]|nr:DUF4900 domain-containing protein [Candidatus Omnitrophota bacterium]